MTSSLHPTAAIILAGGKSERMQKPKPFLPFDAKTTFLEHLIELYKELPVTQIVVVLNKSYHNLIPDNFLFEDITFIFNEDPDLGRLHSVKLGIQTIVSAQATFIQNIDNPLVAKESLNLLMQHLPQEGYLIPVCDNLHGHPILISQELFPKILLSPNSKTLRDVLFTEKKYFVNVPDKGILININTPEDYQKYFQISY
ncbi:MAG: nucleotidyltransferase family protein [Bacteroidia bacterium]|nr:nucleotidyltransferase family protein [Bacteroidia bacterium]